MKKNKVICISDLPRRSAIKSPDAEAGRLLRGFRRLSHREKKTILTLLDAFLFCKDQTKRAVTG